ncbi:hypothetical protein ACHAPJ_012837 [Fusarium lateritium]
MDDLVQKFGHDAAIVVRAFSSIRLCNGQWSPLDMHFLSQAVDAITSRLEGDHGLSMVEFEILREYATRLDPAEQLPFLMVHANTLETFRPASAVTEYDAEFLQFVFQILNGLTGSQGSDTSVMPIPDANLMQHTSNQAQCPALPFEGTLHAPMGTSAQSQTFTSSNVSETGSMFSTMTPSTSTSMSGSMAGSISMSTTSSMFTVSSIPAHPNQFTSSNVNNWIQDLPEVPENMEMEITDTDSQGYVSPNQMETLPEGPRPENLEDIIFDELADSDWSREQVAALVGWIECVEDAQPWSAILPDIGEETL